MEYFASWSPKVENRGPLKHAIPSQDFDAGDDAPALFFRDGRSHDLLSHGQAGRGRDEHGRRCCLCSKGSSAHHQPSSRRCCSVPCISRPCRPLARGLLLTIIFPRAALAQSSRCCDRLPSPVARSARETERSRGSTSTNCVSWCIRRVLLFGVHAEQFRSPCFCLCVLLCHVVLWTSFVAQNTRMCRRARVQFVADVWVESSWYLACSWLCGSVVDIIAPHPPFLQR